MGILKSIKLPVRCEFWLLSINLYVFCHPGTLWLTNTFSADIYFTETYFESRVISNLFHRSNTCLQYAVLSLMLLLLSFPTHPSLCPGSMFLNSSLAHVINTRASTCTIHTCQHVQYIHVLARVVYTCASTCSIHTCQQVRV